MLFGVLCYGGRNSQQFKQCHGKDVSVTDRGRQSDTHARTLSGTLENTVITRLRILRSRIPVTFLVSNCYILCECVCVIKHFDMMTGFEIKTKYCTSTVTCPINEFCSKTFE